jgi:hypothetical protein
MELAIALFGAACFGIGWFCGSAAANERLRAFREKYFGVESRD